jgi:hypothetical protein
VEEIATAIHRFYQREAYLVIDESSAVTTWPERQEALEIDVAASC